MPAPASTAGRSDVQAKRQDSPPPEQPGPGAVFSRKKAVDGIFSGMIVKPHAASLATMNKT